MSYKVKFLLAFLVLCQPCFAERQILDIQPLNQSTVETCWLAVARMLFYYLKVQDFHVSDCEVLKTYYGPSCAVCGPCLTPAGTMQRFQDLLSSYQQRVHGPSAAQIHFDTAQKAIEWAQVVNQIKAQQPVVVGINPFTGPNFIGTYAEPEHVALIVGYDDSTHTLIVNDPAPYQMVQAFYPALQDPYKQADATRLKAWQYEIKYETLVDAFSWQYSAFNIVNPDHPYAPIPPAKPAIGPTLCPGLIQMVKAAETSFPNVKADDSGTSPAQLAKDWNCFFNPATPGWSAHFACTPATSKDARDEEDDYRTLVSQIQRCLQANNLEFTSKPDPNVDADVFTVEGRAFVAPSWDTSIGIDLEITAMPTK